MTTKLKPCPWCGAPARRKIGDTGPTNAYRKWVECTVCTCRTSVHLTEDADDRPADEEWNALPRALVWTTEPPAFGEWNWWRLDPNDENRPICRYVYTDGTIDNTIIGRINWQDIGGQWAGPIPTPQEPAL